MGAHDYLFVVKEFRFSGALSIDEATLRRLATPFLGRQLRGSDLEQLRHLISNHYLELGLINSGAILLTPRPVDGVVRFRLIEGSLSKIRIHGNGDLREEYLIDRLRPRQGEPLNVDLLLERFRRLQSDPLFERLNATLLPGVDPGEAVLEIDVERAPPFSLTTGLDNHGSPATGEGRLWFDATIRNLSGWGEEWQLGIDGNSDRKHYQFALQWPLSADESRFHIEYERSLSRVTEAPLNELDINNRYRALLLGISRPWSTTLQSGITLGSYIEHRESINTLLNEPFSFSSGEIDGRSRTTAIRLDQEYSRREPDYAWAVSSSLTFGVDAFGATIHRDGSPDSRFTTWLGRIQFAKRFPGIAGQLTLRSDLHLANDKLLPAERFAVGGAGSVRGYRENSQTGGLGYLVTTSYSYPVADKVAVAGNIELKTFFDIGSAWSRGEARPDALRAVGVALHWEPSSRSIVELTLARALTKPLREKGESLQERGVHFRIELGLN